MANAIMNKVWNLLGMEQVEEDDYEEDNNLYNYEYEDEEGKWLASGDIVISLETLPKNAEYFEVSQNTELKRLLIHGLLHLNGYDHGEEHIEKGKEPECEMLSLQEKVLKEFADTVLIN